MEKDRKMAKKEKKEKALVEKQRKQLADLSEEEAMMNDEVREKVVKFKGPVLEDSNSEDESVDYDEGIKEKYLQKNPKK